MPKRFKAQKYITLISSCEIRETEKYKKKKVEAGND